MAANFLALKNILLSCILFLLILSPSRIYTLGLFNWNTSSVSYGGSAFSIATLLIMIISIIILVIWLFDSRYNLVTQPRSNFAITIFFLIIIGILFHTTFICYSDNCSTELTGSNLNTIFAIGAAIFFVFSLPHNYASYTFWLGLIFICSLAPILYQLMSYSDIGRGGSLGFSPNELGVIGFALVFHSVFLLLATEKSNKGFKSGRSFIIYLVLAVGSVGVVMSGSRRAILLTLGIVFILPILIGKISFFLKSCLVFVILSFCFYLFFEDIIDYTPSVKRALEIWNTVEAFSDQGRVNIWTTGISSLPDGLLGYGSTGEVSANVYFEETLHSHNILLQLMLQYGPLLGTLVALYILTFSWKALLACRLYFRGLLTYFNVSYVIVVSYTLFSFFDWFFYNPKSIFIFTLALLLSSKRRNRLYD